MLKIYTAAPTDPGTPASAVFDETKLLAQEVGYFDKDSTDSANQITLSNEFGITETADIQVRFYDDTENAGGVVHGIQYGVLLTADTDYTLNTAGANPIVEIDVGSAYDAEYAAIEDSSNTNKRFVVFTAGKLLFEENTFKISGSGDYNINYTTLYLKAEDHDYTEVYFSNGLYYGTGTTYNYVKTASPDAWLWYSVENLPSGTLADLTYTDSIPDTGTSTYKIYSNTGDFSGSWDVVDGNTPVGNTDELHFIHVKGIVPKDAGVPVENFRNLYINVNSVERSSH
jgi:hypothetical protein